MTENPKAAGRRNVGWLPLAGSIVFVAAMTISTAMKLPTLESSGFDGWFVGSLLLGSLGLVALILFAILMATEHRIARRTRALRQANPTAYIAEIANDPQLSKQLHHLVRRIDGTHLRFPSRGTQTLMVDSTGIQLYVGSSNYRKRAGVPADVIERIEGSATPVGQYQMRVAPSVDIVCRTAVEPLTLSLHLLRFAGGWPLFLTASRNAAECQRMLAALAGHSAPYRPGL